MSINSNEADRLAALKQYEILDTPPEQEFDRLTRIASELFSVPMALISLIDESRQWFKSACGAERGETPRDLAFCAHAIQQPEVMIVPDATRDSRFRDHPLVIDEPYIRFYAGAPLITPDGKFALGTLCVVDTEPRPGLTTRQTESLQDLGTLAVDLFELRRLRGSSGGN